MSTYCDTGVLVKSYIFETNSPEAVALLDASGLPLPCSHFHEIEVPNAIRLKRFRKEITPEQESRALRAFQSDRETGRLARPDYDLGDVFLRAATLSAKHSSVLGTRSLDLLHVAAALEAGCEAFVSFDERQRKAAAKEGLEVLPRKSSSIRSIT
jgi:predicted nucleic acid-binding protein